MHCWFFWRYSYNFAFLFLSSFSFFLSSFWSVRMEPRASCTLGKGSATEPPLQTQLCHLSQWMRRETLSTFLTSIHPCCPGAAISWTWLIIFKYNIVIFYFLFLVLQSWGLSALLWATPPVLSFSWLILYEGFLKLCFLFLYCFYLILGWRWYWVHTTELGKFLLNLCIFKIYEDLTIS